MRFTKLSMALAISLVLSATTCSGQDVTNPYSDQQQQQPTGGQPRTVFRKESKTPFFTPPTNDARLSTASDSYNNNNNNMNALSRRHHRRQFLSLNLRNDIQQPPIIQSLYINKKRSSWESAPAPAPHVQQRERIQQYKRRSRMMKREGPRRLSGERRAGLLGSIVDDMGQPPADSTSSSSDSDESSSENESAPSPTGEAMDEPTSIDPPEDVELTPTTEEPIAVATTIATVPIIADPAPAPVSAPIPTPVDPPTSAAGNNNGNTNGSNNGNNNGNNKSNNNNNDNGNDSGPPKGPKPSTPDLIAKEPAQPTDVGSPEAGQNSTTAVTAGVVMVTILIVSVIGVWVFRKWKLSPSRQFKSKISGGADGGASAGNYGAGHDDVSGYNNYDEFFRRQSTPSVHDPSALPPMSCATSVAGMAMSPYNPPYPPHHHQPHMSISSASGSAIAAGSAADYNQYQQPYNAYDVNVVPAHLAPAPSTIGGLPAVGHNIHSYGSDDFNQNHNFLRELRGT